MELDGDQAAVVALADDGDAVVLGAAGTGKTTTIVELVADRVLERGWAPGELLVLGATRRSAGALRDRLAARLAVPTPGPIARTAASLAHSILAAAAVRLDAPPPVYVSGADHDRIIRGLLEAEVGDESDAYWTRAGLGRDLRMLPAFRGEVRDLIARAVERGVSATRLRELGTARGRPEWTAVGTFWPKLAAQIEVEHAGYEPLDSNYVLRRAADLVSARDPSAPGLRLVVVDDAQELGFGGLRLLGALGTGGARLIAFGDPDLATQTFRGAVPAGFTAADGVWAVVGREPARLVLGTAHRHGEVLRGAVARAVSGMNEPAKGFAGRRQVQAGAQDGRIEAVRVPGVHEQAAFVARRLRERHARDGVPFGSMAVVGRSAGSAARLARELRGMHVPTEVGGETARDGSDYATHGLLLALAIATGVVELDADRAEELLASCVGRLDAVALRRLRTGLRAEALKVGRDESGRELLVEALRIPAAFDVLDFAPARAARRVAEALEALRIGLGTSATVEEALWEIWARSGLEQEWGGAARGVGLDADLANEQLDDVLSLFDAAKRFVERTPGAPVAAFVTRQLGARLADDSLARRAVSDAVLVGTPSSLLGREFDTVVVVDLEDGVWPNLRTRGSLLRRSELVEDSAVATDPATLRKELLDDELRMLASAIGRSRRRLIAVGVLGGDVAPSPFLRRIAPWRDVTATDESGVAATYREPEIEDVGTAGLEPLTLRGLTARLRRELARSIAAGERSEADRARTAAGLVRLAAAGVPGADPASWYGIPDITTDAPLREPDESVRVSPSRLETFETCQLHWAIEQLGGRSGSFAASVGTIVHAVAERIDRESVDEVLPEIEHALTGLPYDSEWEAEADRLRAGELARRLVAYQSGLHAEGGETIGREVAFEVPVGRAVLTGRIDRIERMADETAVIVDFKTGKETRYASDASVADHPQLAAYQVALVEGGLRDDVAELTAALANGGAKLVILGRDPKKRSGGVDAPRQAALDDAQLEEWRRRIRDAAESMGGRTFIASVATHCTDRYSYGPCAIHIVEAVSE
ncbi:MAG TPA: ATP-dependent DNA helicase [Microbacteriaceae bacterium]|nr:ATP-dependent DNA helicase [Microbacteriaceae bacterium]